jgi:hypothetical protein
MSGRHSAESAVCRLCIWEKSDRDGVVFRLWRSTRRRHAIIIFPESGLEELQLIMEAFVFIQSPGCVQVWKNGSYVEGMVMWSRVQVECGVVRFSVDLTAQRLIRSPYMSTLGKGKWPFFSISLVNCVFLLFRQCWWSGGNKWRSRDDQKWIYIT